MFFLFCFKQKTAYEMRISDWSSDVCSSDLEDFGVDRLRRPMTRIMGAVLRGHALARPIGNRVVIFEGIAVDVGRRGQDVAVRIAVAPPAPGFGRAAQFRSEEHTSELQSLMRISYAVFCLKKKNTHTQQPHLYQTVI